MKKSFKFLCLMLTVFMMTGCMKYEWKMSVNKDKSMNFEITAAVAASLMQQAGSNQLMTDNEELQSIKDAGFTVKNYSDGTMTGYTFTKKIANIDDVSSEKEVKYNPEQAMTEKNPKIFTVKKGFFKNTYTLTVENNTSDELENGMNSIGTTENIDETDDITNAEDININTPNTTQDNTESNTINPENSENNITTDEIEDDIDLSTLTSSMDMTFNINLPYEAVSSNATSTENNGKTLKWNLLDNNLKNVTATFELYNMNNIYLTAGIAGAAVLVIIVIIIIKKRKPKTQKPVQDTVYKEETIASVPQGLNDSQSINTVNQMLNNEIVTPELNNQSMDINPVNPTPTVETLNPEISQTPVTAQERNTNETVTPISQVTNTQSTPNNISAPELNNQSMDINSVNPTPTVETLNPEISQTLVTAQESNTNETVTPISQVTNTQDIPNNMSTIEPNNQSININPFNQVPNSENVTNESTQTQMETDSIETLDISNSQNTSIDEKNDKSL